MGSQAIKFIVCIEDRIMTVDGYACDGLCVATIGVDVRIAIIAAHFGDCFEAVPGIVCVGNGECCGRATV